MDLSNFKLLKEDDTHYHVQHPKGTMLAIEKEKLKPAAHEMIKKMACGGEVKAYADGGEIDDEESTLPVSTDASTMATQQSFREQQSYPDAVGMMLPAFFQPKGNQVQAPQVPYSPLMPNQNQQFMDQGSTQTGSEFPAVIDNSGQQQDYLKQLQDTRKKEADLYTNAAKQIQGAAPMSQTQASQYLPNASESQDNLLDFKTQYDINQANANTLYSNLANNKIDPNHYWNSMSTGSKVASGIALLLGGIGSGITKTPNMAMQMIDNAMQRDLQSQIQNQSNQQNLYRMNLENMGSARQAYLATQNQMMTALKFKLDLAAQHAGNIGAATNMQLAANHVQQSIDQGNFMLSMMQDNKIDPAFKVQYLVPQPMQAKAYDAVDKAKKMAEMGPLMMREWDAAAKDFKDVSGVTEDMIRSNPHIAAIKSMADPFFKDEMGRYNAEAANNFYSGILPRRFTGDDEYKTTRGAMQNFITRPQFEGSSMLGNFGIHLAPIYNRAQYSKVNPGDIVSVKGKHMQVDQTGKNVVPIDMNTITNPLQAGQ